MLVGSKSQMMCCAGGAYCLLAHALSALASHHLNLAWLVFHTPHDVIGVLVLGPYALTLAVDEEFHLVGIVIIAPHVDGLTGQPVPVREQMEHRLLCPLALIHVIHILREAGKVYYSEITAACWEPVWCWLADVVETCPDELSADESIMLHHIPRLLVG